MSSQGSRRSYVLHPASTVDAMTDVPYRVMTALACAWLAVNLIRGLWPKK